MALRYMLDTNILSDLIRHPQGEVARHIVSKGEDSICTSIVVACEHRRGAEKTDSIKLRERVDALLASLEDLPFDTPADRQYGKSAGA